MSDILLADIGGTTTRTGFAEPGGRPRGIVVVANDSFPDVESLIAQSLAQSGLRPRAAVLAIAGPVDGDAVALTNRSWRFRLADLSARFGMSFHAVNDFEALAWGLTLLGADDARTLGAASPRRNGVKIVIGPGTGLGVAALVPVKDGWHAVPGEGGHVSFGAASPDESAVFARLAADGAFVSAERVLSGPGLARLHRAVNPGVLAMPPEMILTQARAGHREARNTIALFVRLLGRFAGDMALTFKAAGGVYIAGGVAFGLGALLDPALFRAAFEAHPPHQALLASIPTSLITCEEPGLLGCSAFAARAGC
ncbi:MAG: ROK family protein [Pseudorhodoplanes sp.]